MTRNTVRPEKVAFRKSAWPEKIAPEKSARSKKVAPEKIYPGEARAQEDGPAKEGRVLEIGLAGEDHAREVGLTEFNMSLDGKEKAFGQKRAIELDVREIEFGSASSSEPAGSLRPCGLHPLPAGSVQQKLFDLRQLLRRERGEILDRTSPFLDQEFPSLFGKLRRHEAVPGRAVARVQLVIG